MQIPEPIQQSTLERWWLSIDKPLLFTIGAIATVGMILSFSANLLNTSDIFMPVVKQGIFLVIALFIMCGLSFGSPTHVRRIGIIVFLVGLVLLIILPFVGTGHNMGAVRWYSVFGFSFQPSELYKPGFVITSAWLISARHGTGSAPPGTFLSLIVLIISCSLLITQPDFGQTALIALVWSVMFFVSGASILWIVLAGGGMAAGAITAYMNPALGHVRDRIEIFINGDPDPYSQVAYAHKAIINGGLTGVGPGNGQMIQHLSDSDTDFIMAVAAEEYGLLICIPIIVLFAFLVIRSLAKVLRSKSPFVQIAGTGLTALIGIQAFINIAVAVRLAPAKGMTLPFISQGGSSLISVGITLGLLLALTQSTINRSPSAKQSPLFGRFEGTA